jgi:hypothetical protein
LKRYEFLEDSTFLTFFPSRLQSSGILVEAAGIERSLHYRSSKSGDVGETTFITAKFIPDGYRKKVLIHYSDFGDLVVRVIGITKLLVFLTRIITHYIN